MHNMKAEDIKKIREALGLTQEQFARRLGVSFVTVNRWENSKAIPSTMAIALIRQLEGGVK